MKISNAEIEDAEKLALLHKQVFGKIHFTANFSNKLLVKYFENLIKNMNYKLVTKSDGNTVGYLFADKNSGVIINDFLNKNFFKILFYLLLNPHFILEKISELFNKIFSQKKDGYKEVSLYLIAADTRLGGKGIGKELVKHFESSLKNENEKSYTLSVRNNNQQAINFYLKNNFVQISSNKKSIKFRKVFDD